MRNLITIQDALIVPFLLIVVYFIATKIRNKHIEEEPYYKYFRIGLFVKIWAGLAFAAIYLFYYGGGDTVYYYWGTGNIVKMFGKDIPTFFRLIAGDHSMEVYSMFDRSTGWPTYFRDPNSFAVCRFNLPFYLLGFGSFLGNTIIMNFFLFFGIWRFYKMLIELYPNNEKWLAYAMFFIPSVVFWSSGILKDVWTSLGILVIFISLYNIFFKRDAVFKNLLMLVLWSYISFSIRSFIFYIALGSALLWIGFSISSHIKSKFIRTLVFPFVIIAFWSIGTFILSKSATLAGERYSSIESMLETAQIIQDDLKRDYYQGNSFDIGSFDATIPSILAKFPKATIAGLFRPFIWESKNIVMMLSGLESLLSLLLLIYIFLRGGSIKLLKSISADPFFRSIFLFMVTYSFIIGLTISNFGAMVRYRIPGILFFYIILGLLLSKRINNPDTLTTDN